MPLENPQLGLPWQSSGYDSGFLEGEGSILVRELRCRKSRGMAKKKKTHGYMQCWYPGLDPRTGRKKINGKTGEIQVI